ncbi:ABC transporter ATP-binding protein [Verticiella sediminum]|uniref:ABC transporter ATP-binding protein n=2 Tax=Verticiella sediminum TaxID=1247510 RepID=A0A556AMW2_9BURK|nr:ABC transporter ATP-binding protein [Verticiella sediminum]
MSSVRQAVRDEAAPAGQAPAPRRPGPGKSMLLELCGVSVSYPSRRGPVLALDKLDLAVQPSSFVSVLGPSGCGKSTLVKLVSGLLKPTTGTIEFDGVPASGARDDVGVAFQQAALLPWKSALENVLLPIRLTGKSVQTAAARARSLLDLVGLSGFHDRYPHELSGGMQQRVSLARSLIRDPSILVMDEPFSALDAMTRENMMIELQRIWLETRPSVLFITHSIQEAVFLSDRVVVMSGRPGKVIEDVAIDLPRPRDVHTLADPRFVELSNHLRDMFNREH